MPWICEKNSHKRLFTVLAVLLASAAVGGIFVMEAVNRNYTTRHLAAALRPELTARDRVYLYGQPGAFYDFAFYLRRPVRLVGLEGELEFDREDAVTEPHEREAFVSRADWEKDAVRRDRYTLMRVSDYRDLDADLRARLAIFTADKRKVLVRGTQADGSPTASF